MFQLALHHFDDIKASLRFISFEPLLNRIEDAHLVKGFDWLIIGAMTARSNEALHLSNRYPDLTLMPYGRMWTLQPDREWVAGIIHAADKARVPVFLKNNLMPLFPETFRDREYAAPPFFTPDWDYRQEMPTL